MTVPCETCSTPERCNCLPFLDDWVDGHPDTWDFEAVLRENGVVVDGNGNEHRAGPFAGWASIGSTGPSTSVARPRSSPARPPPCS
jgi:hypothetical protein